jgi:hypothetical protein
LRHWLDLSRLAFFHKDWLRAILAAHLNFEGIRVLQPPIS